MTKIIPVAVLGGILSFASSIHAQDKQPHFTLKDKLSYSLGIKAGTNLSRELLQQDFETHDINLDMLLKGLQDSFLGNSFLLTETELRSVLLDFQKQKHHRETVVQQLKMLAALLSTYRLDTGEYPANLEELITNTANNKFWKGPYLEDKNTLKDPWGNLYQYRYPGRNKNLGMYNYDLFSYGADGTEGGQEENADIFFQTQTGGEPQSSPPSPTVAPSSSSKNKADPLASRDRGKEAPL